MQGDEARAAGGASVATRAFALQCLHALADSLARDDSSLHVLEACIPETVQCAFGVVEEKAESLTAAALGLLSRVLAAFSGAPDPESAADGGLLMDVFAAPYVTALKTSLSGTEASLAVTAAGNLAAALLPSGLLRSDPGSVEVRRCPHLSLSLSLSLSLCLQTERTRIDSLKSTSFLCRDLPGPLRHYSVGLSQSAV